MISLVLFISHFCSCSGSSRTFIADYQLLSQCRGGERVRAVQNHIGNVYEPQIVGLMNGSWLGLGAFGGAVGLFVNSAGLQRTGNYIMPINAIASVIVIGFVLSAFFSTPKRPA